MRISMNTYQAHLKDAQALSGAMLADSALEQAFNAAVSAVVSAVKSGKTLFVAGNGGSAGEAQHFAAEMTGRYKKERKGIAAIALTTDTSALTAIGNDYSFDEVFSRQLSALSRFGDVLICMSTSGNSENILRAIAYAKENGVYTIALGGRGGGKMAQAADLAIIVPSDDTARIQEVHLLLIHALSEEIEAECAS